MISSSKSSTNVSFNNTIQKITIFEDISYIEYLPISDYTSVLRNKKRNKLKHVYNKFYKNRIKVLF